MANDVVISFGPDGNYSLHVPVKDLNATAITAESFIRAGEALLIYAHERAKSINNPDQKVFEWMKESAEVTA
jgi:hypothetical protein